jgi:hypothetical protein
MTLLPEDPALTALSDTGMTPGRDFRGPRCVSSRVTGWHYNGRGGGEILLVRCYRDGREVWI